jgi:hypothetical protein
MKNYTTSFEIAERLGKDNAEIRDRVLMFCKLNDVPHFRDLIGEGIDWNKPCIVDTVQIVDYPDIEGAILKIPTVTLFNYTISPFNLI